MSPYKYVFCSVGKPQNCWQRKKFSSWTVLCLNSHSLVVWCMYLGRDSWKGRKKPYVAARAIEGSYSLYVAVIARNSGCKGPLKSPSQTHHEATLQQCRGDKGLFAAWFSQYPNRIGDSRSGLRVGKGGKEWQKEEFKLGFTKHKVK